MFVLFTNLTTTNVSLVNNYQERSLEDLCKILFPNLELVNDKYLVEQDINKGYIYNSKTEKKIYSIQSLDLDVKLHDTLEEYTMYSTGVNDSDSSDEMSVSSSNMISFSHGYAPNLITNNFCGFGFTSSYF